MSPRASTLMLPGEETVAPSVGVRLRLSGEHRLAHLPCLQVGGCHVYQTALSLVYRRLILLAGHEKVESAFAVYGSLRVAEVACAVASQSSSMPMAMGWWVHVFRSRVVLTHHWCPPRPLSEP